MKAFADVMEDFTEVTSTNDFVEASVEASMEDTEDLKASTEANSQKLSWK